MNRREFVGTSLGLAGDAALTSSTLGRKQPAGEGPGVNVKIQEAREVASEILKPSRKVLEHGLELHANSVVFDAYGFSPRASVDGEGLRQAIQAGASDIELRDLREEMSMTRCVTDATERAEYVAAWEASG